MNTEELNETINKLGYVCISQWNIVISLKCKLYKARCIYIYIYTHTHICAGHYYISRPRKDPGMKLSFINIG